MNTYKVNEQGIIVSPGKFEGCPSIAPKLWEQGLEGFADSTFEGGYGFVIIGNREVPNLNLEACILTEDDLGFVHFEGFDGLVSYQAAIEEIEAECEDSSWIDDLDITELRSIGT